MIERDPVPILSQMVAFGMVAQFKHDQEST
jgi:hypothetical protein